jgi:hypothetical protein
MPIIPVTQEAEVGLQSKNSPAKKCETLAEKNLKTKSKRTRDWLKW